MTMNEVFSKAWIELVNEWSHEKEFLEMHPDDELAKIRETNAWNKISELKALADEMNIKL